MADRSQLCKSSKYPHELHGLHDELIQTPVVLNYVLTYTRLVSFICVFFFENLFPSGKLEKRIYAVMQLR